MSSTKHSSQTLSRERKELQKNINKQRKNIVQLMKIGSILSSQKNIDEIFGIILHTAIDYTNADGATIYSVTPDKKFLEFKIVFNRSLNIKLESRNDKIHWSKIPLYTENNCKQMKHLVTYVYHTKELQQIEDVYDQKLFNNRGTQDFDDKNNYHSKSMLAVPMKNHEDEIIGIIQLINAMTDDDKEIIPFSKDHLLMLNSLASQAAITLTNRKLVESFEQLLFQFIKSIGKALDIKSKDTSNHITQVAEITNIIADAINEADNGYFKDINFNEDEKKEISVSGWMHDIGKIIIPEKVMNKSTKLETIVDRIEVVKLRFEIIFVILEKEIMKLENENDSESEILELKELQKNLQYDLSFLKEKNFGREFLTQKDAERLKKITDFRFSDCNKEYFLVTSDELENLLIKRGTLTDAEYSKIQSHANVTWEMLSSLSFPKKYKNVPVYASSHHEKLNGSGYPFGFTEEKIPLPARIIAISDIFEALVSKRQYKKRKKLSKVIEILSEMAKNNEIDKKLVNFILESGLYHKLAEKYIPKEKIDSVNIEKLV